MKSEQEILAKKDDILNNLELSRPLTEKDYKFELSSLLDWVLNVSKKPDVEKHNLEKFHNNFSSIKIKMKELGIKEMTVETFNDFMCEVENGI
jgi:hypothetical protein